MRLPADLEALLAERDTPLDLWWRDDDAGRDDERLCRLLDIAKAHGAPVALAVVPCWLEPCTADRLCRADGVTVLQHGYEHADHSRPDQRKIELGGVASPDDLGPAIAAARERLAAMFGARFLPVMVPPWNRIDASFADGLRAWGFTGLSTWHGGGRDAGGLPRRDTHIDAVDWRNGRRCLDTSELLDRVIECLRARFPGPIGLLTHHLATTDEGFRSLDQVLGLVQDHRKLRILSAATLFSEAP